jgi:hypothetical protein
MVRPPPPPARLYSPRTCNCGRPDWHDNIFPEVVPRRWEWLSGGVSRLGTTQVWCGPKGTGWSRQFTTSSGNMRVVLKSCMQTPYEIVNECLEFTTWPFGIHRFNLTGGKRSTSSHFLTKCWPSWQSALLDATHNGQEKTSRGPLDLHHGFGTPSRCSTKIP